MGEHNMPNLEVFFDYSCPYCLTGHTYLKELLPTHPDIEVIWRPCEAHPRPETYGLHSDLCIQGLFYFLDQGVDVWEYHERMYGATLKDRFNIEDPDVIAGRIHGLLDHDAFLKTIYSGKYEKAVAEANDYAYERSGVWAVPSYRMDGRKLDSIENVGVTKRQLADFLSGGRTTR